MKSRFNCYFDPKLADRLSELALRQGVHRSQLVEAAVASFLSPDALDRREAAYVRRLDRISRQIERVERDLTIAIEAQALFVRFWLSVTAPVPGEPAGGLQGARVRSAIRAISRRSAGGCSAATASCARSARRSGRTAARIRPCRTPSRIPQRPAKSTMRRRAADAGA